MAEKPFVPTGLQVPPDEESTPIVVTFRVTRAQLADLEWALKNSKFRWDPPKPPETPEEWLAYRLLPDASKALADVRKARVHQEVEERLKTRHGRTP